MDHYVHMYLHVVLFALWFGGSTALVLMLARLRQGAVTGVVDPALLDSIRTVVRVPKTAFILMLPMGLQLSSNLGLIELHGGTTLGAWLFALVWLAIDWTGAPMKDTDFARAMRAVERVLQAAFLLILGGAGVLSLIAQGPVGEEWLATKMVLYGVTLLLMLGFDFALLPLYKVGADGKVDAEAAGKGATMALAMLVALLVILCGAAWVGLTAWRG